MCGFRRFISVSSWQRRTTLCCIATNILQPEVKWPYYKHCNSSTLLEFLSLFAIFTLQFFFDRILLTPFSWFLFFKSKIQLPLHAVWLCFWYIIELIIINYILLRCKNVKCNYEIKETKNNPKKYFQSF